MTLAKEAGTIKGFRLFVSVLIFIFLCAFASLRLIKSLNGENFQLYT